MIKSIFIFLVSIGVYANGTEPVSTEKNNKKNVSHDHVIFFDVKLDEAQNFIINKDIHIDYDATKHTIEVSDEIEHHHGDISQGFVAKLKRHFIDDNKNGTYDLNEKIIKYEMVETFISKAKNNGTFICNL